MTPERSESVPPSAASAYGTVMRTTAATKPSETSVAITGAPPTVARWRRTDGAAAATAKMMTAVRTSTSSFGTTALTASAPCDSVPKRSAASTTPSGRARPSTATAMPM